MKDSVDQAMGGTNGVFYGDSKRKWNSPVDDPPSKQNPKQTKCQVVHG
jgi:hypothetical protein